MSFRDLEFCFSNSRIFKVCVNPERKTVRKHVHIRIKADTCTKDFSSKKYSLCAAVRCNLLVYKTRKRPRYKQVLHSQIVL